MRWGLALSGGGARGGAHVGVIQALAEQGLAPDVVSGTSAGALVAGVYASGCNGAALNDILGFMAREGKRLLDPDIRRLTGSLMTLIHKKQPYADGLFCGNRLAREFMRVTHDMELKQACLPVALVACDINRASRVVFTNARNFQPDNDVVLVRDAKIWEGMRASMAIPVTFRPFYYEDMRLVDGGVVDILPVDMARRMGAQRVIAVDVGYNGEDRMDVDNLVEIGMQSLSVMAYTISQSQRNAADLVLTPKMGDVGTLDIERVMEAYEAGYEAAMQAMPRIKRALGEGSVQVLARKLAGRGA